MAGKVKSVKKVVGKSFHNHHLHTLNSEQIQALLDSGIEDKEKYKRVVEALEFAKAHEGKPKELDWLDN